MKKRASIQRPLGTLLALFLLLLPVSASSQTEFDPDFTLLSEEQDIEIGRQASREIEQRFPVMDDPAVTDYVSRLGGRLAARAPGYDFPYQFDVLNVSDANAFALPGGFIYLTRGLVEAAPSEPQLAAVLAHEIAHVALRHSTSQATKSRLSQTGLALLTELIGGRTATEIARTVGGIGLNVLFLEFSRDDEEEADRIGVQILAAAGYTPLGMARMFETLQEHSGEGDGTPTFLRSHPPYDERQEVVRQEARHLPSVEPGGHVGGLHGVQERLDSMPEARPMDAYVERR